jgi:hypothetical protein
MGLPYSILYYGPGRRRFRQYDQCRGGLGNGIPGQHLQLDSHSDRESRGGGELHRALHEFTGFEVRGEGACISGSVIGKRDGGTPDIAGNVLIQNNNISTEMIPGDEVLPGARLRAPFAVYVGNVNDLLVLENQAVVQLPSSNFRAQAGVVVFGALGPRILVRGNHFDGFRTGNSNRENAAVAGNKAVDGVGEFLLQGCECGIGSLGSATHGFGQQANFMSDSS